MPPRLAAPTWAPLPAAAARALLLLGATLASANAEDVGGVIGIDGRSRDTAATQFMGKKKTMPDIDESGLLDDEESEETPVERTERLFGDRTLKQKARHWQNFAAHLSKEKRALAEQVQNLTDQLHTTQDQLQQARREAEESSAENQRLWATTKTAAGLSQEREKMLDMISKLSSEVRRLKGNAVMRQKSANDCEREAERLTTEAARLQEEKQTLYWKVRELTG
mmetsp:Transcript_22937/g.64043  ORF Transcript_22937/g.64043 Transcript_22937/m.64043 type:complete len:224 (+) Transcript_22937:56-727(+)